LATVTATTRKRDPSNQASMPGTVAAPGNGR
jgi:hypothetical protein